MDAYEGSSNDSVLAEELHRSKREGSLDEEPLMENEMPYRLDRNRYSRLNMHPLPAALILAGSCLTTLILGFVLGRIGPNSSDVMSTPFAKDFYAWMKNTTETIPIVQATPAAPTVAPAPAGLLGIIPPEHVSIFDLFQMLPPVDLYQEYGLRHSELSLYPSPLKEQICIVNADTRKWSPEEHKDLKGMDVLHWGYLNHYLYAQIHGYTFKHVQAPEQEGLHSTWVKIKEIYRMTLRDECKFVIMLDGDTIFEDLRVPLEALLSHWNITSEITVAGGVDIDKSVDDRGQLQLNTGFVITQKTPILDRLMLDWIDCPTDVKYQNCSKWKENWSHEQAALSNYIRYDPDYIPYIRELPVEEVHLGGFVKHYWDREKPKLERASKDAILNRFLPSIYRGLLNDWSRIHEHPTLSDYNVMMSSHRPQEGNSGSIRRA